MNRKDSIGVGVGAASRGIPEERLKRLQGVSGEPLEADEMARLLHGLLVHQVELEMQNEELVEARAELEENAGLLAELYDFAPVGYFSLSANGLIRQLNFLGAQLLGMERAPLLGADFARFVIPESRRAFTHFLSRVFAYEDPEPCEVTLARHGQPEVIVRLTGTLSLNGLVCRMAAMDVTEHRRVEAAAREKNDDLDRIFNLSHDLLCIAGSDGRFHRVNPAFERLLGHGRDMLTGRGFMGFVHPDDREATTRALARLRAGEEVMDFVNRYRCVDGSFRWLEWRVIPYGGGLMCAVARDITEKKAALEALRESERKFRSIVESSPTAMYIYQLGEDDRLILIEANGAADQELGIPHAGLIGKSLEEAFPGLAETGIPAMYRAVARGEIGPHQFDFGYNERGISGYFEVSVFQSNPGTIVVAFSDISERKTAREALEKAHEELEVRVQKRTKQLQVRSRQLRALAGELSHAEERERRRIAGLIHEDLQQMLVAAVLNLGMLKSKIASSESEEEFFQIEGILRDSIKTARSLTSELSPPVLQQCGLAAALKWLRTWYGEKYAMDVRVDAEEGADPGPEVAGTLFRCVRELLFNVVKHGGVRTAKLHLWRADGDVLKIEVSDEGAGFDPQEVRAREGSVGGFGLFSIRERLEWLGGGMEMISSPGAGSCFVLWVPLHNLPLRYG